MLARKFFVWTKVSHYSAALDETVSELKQNLEQAKKEWQEEKEQLMNQIKELQGKYSGRKCMLNSIFFFTHKTI